MLLIFYTGRLIDWKSRWSNGFLILGFLTGRGAFSNSPSYNLFFAQDMEGVPTKKNMPKDEKWTLQSDNQYSIDITLHPLLNSWTCKLHFFITSLFPIFLEFFLPRFFVQFFFPSWQVQEKTLLENQYDWSLFYTLVHQTDSHLKRAWNRFFSPFLHCE